MLIYGYAFLIACKYSITEIVFAWMLCWNKQPLQNARKHVWICSAEVPRSSQSIIFVSLSRMNQIVLLYHTSLSGANSVDNRNICLACTNCTFDRDMSIHSGTPSSNMCCFGTIQHAPETLRSSCKNAPGANLFDSHVTSKALAWHSSAMCFIQTIQASSFHRPSWENWSLKSAGSSGVPVSRECRVLKSGVFSTVAVSPKWSITLHARAHLPCCIMQQFQVGTGRMHANA